MSFDRQVLTLILRPFDENQVKIVQAISQIKLRAMLEPKSDFYLIHGILFVMQEFIYAKSLFSCMSKTNYTILYR